MSSLDASNCSFHSSTGRGKYIVLGIKEGLTAYYKVDAWDNPDFRAAVKATGKKQIILAGIVTEVCTRYLFLFHHIMRYLTHL